MLDIVRRNMYREGITRGGLSCAVLPLSLSFYLVRQRHGRKPTRIVTRSRQPPLRRQLTHNRSNQAICMQDSRPMPLSRNPAMLLRQHRNRIQVMHRS